MDELPTSSISDEGHQHDAIESDAHLHHQEPAAQQDYILRSLVNFNQQQNDMQLVQLMRHQARYDPPFANASESTPEHLPGRDIPSRSRQQILQRYENELQSLNGHWNSICIALTSIRSSYLAVLSSPSTAESQQQQQQRESESATSSTSTSSTSSPTSMQHAAITDFLIPSTVAVTSFMTSRTTTATQSDYEQELLLAVDDATFQIRQLEARIERLEAHIQELIQSVPRRQQQP
ncbi:hypothetical protein K492DRAFT_194753 [Lichtheimia hyalospora FSU 10163]|nr:hypothetical protein K492DRAFT_194753 [Lichtheimia hyalospora FSU 10163]